MFVLDNNFIIDVVARRSSKSSEYAKVMAHIIESGQCAIPSCSLHNLEYVLRKQYPADLVTYHRLLPTLKVIKTPSYVDVECDLAKADIEDYLIDISARAVGGHVITSNKVFLKHSELAIHPDDYFDVVRKQRHTIPFCDLKTQYQQIRPRIEQQVDGVLTHGQYIMGPEVQELEEKLAAYSGADHCITVSSGTEALLISLMALGVGPGDEVITTPFTFVATAEVIALVGATPVFVDVEPATCNIDASLIEGAITSRTKAIIPVSLYGQVADMDEINAIAARHGHIPVIEDAAQSFGATYKGRKSCNLSTIGCTSFFPSKPLGCYGDGGAIFTNDASLAGVVREIRIHGQQRRYHHTRVGVGGRMDTLQCAVILAKLGTFDWEIERRINIGNRYAELLNRSGAAVTQLQVKPDRTCVWAQYTVFTEHREKLQESLKQQGIPTAIHYPVPLHRQPAYETSCRLAGSMTVAETIADRVISLPMHPYLSAETQEQIARAVAEVVHR